MMKAHDLEMVAFNKAVSCFIDWAMVWEEYDIDPEGTTPEDQFVIWSNPDLEYNVGSHLRLAVGEMNAGEELSDNTTSLWAFISSSQKLTSR